MVLVAMLKNSSNKFQNFFSHQSFLIEKHPSTTIANKGMKGMILAEAQDATNSF